MRAPDTKGDYLPLGPSDRQIADAKAKAKPADVVKNVKPGVRTRNGKFETCEPKNEAAKMEWAVRQFAKTIAKQAAAKEDREGYQYCRSSPEVTLNDLRDACLAAVKRGVSIASFNSMKREP